ncbi:flagellin [Candidatus Epulonipiscium viviparus]|uniref:flagellin N-terminal helical domain-containing protein n=1 Tax=Candidatus Epulonipiscium viviparus TaxID=420336 RepID=UPI00016BFF57|nr:flagellin [Candidatus Epulopiscium viviparus]
MRINTNLMAINSQRNLTINQGDQGSIMEKLSSGLRINRAGDDAAGLAISEKMRNQIKGLQQSSSNAQDGISLIQTTEGALGETHEMLKRMREMSIQSMNDTYTSEDRKKLDIELKQLITEIDGIADKTEFNEQKLLTGDPTGKGLDLVASARTSLTNAVGTYYDKVAEYQGKLAAAYSIDGGSSMADLENRVLDLEQEISALEIKAAGASDETEAQKILASVAGKQVSLEKTKASLAFVESESAALKASASDILKSAVKLEQSTVVEKANKLQATMNQEVGPNEFTFQVGANNDQSIQLNIKAMNVTALGLTATKIDTPESANIALNSIDAAVEIVSRQRAELGAVQNRLEHTVKSLDNTAENLQSAESQIRDADMAAEMVNLTRVNILAQASQSMLAQANQAPQQVLQLLG